MCHMREIAESINALASYGYHDSAVEYAAIHALNNASMHRGRKRKRVVEDSLVGLIGAGADFNISSAYRICLHALAAIDDAASIGIELSVQDALNEAMELDNV